MGLASETAGPGRRCRLHRHQLSGLRAMMREASGPSFHDHRHRRTGRLRQRHARQTARRPLRPAASRYRADLPGGGQGPARRRPSARRPRAGVAAAEALDPAKFDDAALKATRSARRPRWSRRSRRCAAALLAFQREFGRTPPGAVLDGRDIGTVIFPDADVKIFVTATPEVRARRRAAELQAAGHQSRPGRGLADIRRRDERDTSRAAAPLKPAADAHLLDTTHLDIDAAFRAAIDIVEAVRAGRERG